MPMTKIQFPGREERVLYVDGAEVERATKWSSLVLDLEVNLHEVIGHASGRVSDRLKGDPASAIKEHYSALEEARADLVALWFLGDPKLVELQVVAREQLAQVSLAAYEIYTRKALTQLRRVRAAATNWKRTTCETGSSSCAG